MKTQLDVRWLIRRVSFPLGVNLAITGGILDIVFR